MSPWAAIWRYEIPVDNKDHEIVAPPMQLITSVAVVGPPGVHTVEFWAMILDLGTGPVTQTFTVVETGRVYSPENWVYVATAPRTADGLVFHLLQRRDRLHAVPPTPADPS